MTVGDRKAEITEKRIGHRRVVVLASVHEDALVSSALEGNEDRSNFHEIGASTRNNEDFHSSA